MATSNPTTIVENWKPVVGFDGLYEVSDLGNVRSMGRLVPYPNSRPRRLVGRTLRPARNVESGYPFVNLRRNGRQRIVCVHTLVLEAFVGPRPEGMECCHWDGNPENNRLDNLRWDTHIANKADDRRNGVLKRGEQLPQARLTVAKVLEIRIAAASGEKSRFIAARYGVCR